MTSLGAQAGEPIVIRWDKGKSIDTIAGLDLVERDVKWEARPCPSPNFIKATAAGILVGCENSQLSLLNPVDGSERWRRNFAQDQPIAVNGAHKSQKKYDIDKYRGEALGGYLVSDSEEAYFFVSAKGEYLIRCDRRCADALLSAKPHAGKFLVMHWDYGKYKGVAAFDITNHKIAWEWSDCRMPNFVEPTSVGFLVGCDDGSVALLNGDTGTTVWRNHLASEKLEMSKRELQIGRYHGERPEGFVVSHSNNVFIFIGKKGELLMHCDQQCVQH
ncbi:MAG TPA: hypothetical protein VJS66_01255 [Burkholderiales bacterium]|nr:hypothetical protein [Burkholderiales bacterium]